MRILSLIYQRLTKVKRSQGYILEMQPIKFEIKQPMANYAAVRDISVVFSDDCVNPKNLVRAVQIK